jgi:hypothetical protein
MTESRLPPPEIGYKDVSGDEAAQLWARQMKSVGAGLLYGFVALLMGFINKVISNADFPADLPSNEDSSYAI